MGSTLKTQNYQLSQFTATDKPSWINDYDSDMRKIDTGIAEAKTTADKAGADSGGALAAAQAAQVAAESAQTAATAANTKANEASTTATTALTQANKGVTDAATAFDHADTAITIATEADNKAVAATTAANNAQNTATAADVKAVNASNNAASADALARQADIGPKFMEQLQLRPNTYVTGQFPPCAIVGRNRIQITWDYNFDLGSSIPAESEGYRSITTFVIPASWGTLPANTTIQTVGFITFLRSNFRSTGQLAIQIPSDNTIVLRTNNMVTDSTTAGSVTFSIPFTNN